MFNNVFTKPKKSYFEQDIHSTNFLAVPKLFVTGLPVILCKFVSNNLFSQSLYYFFTRNGFTYMKIGQWLSSRNDILTKEDCEKLSMLHKNAPVHSLKESYEILKNDFSEVMYFKYNESENCCVKEFCDCDSSNKCLEHNKDGKRIKNKYKIGIVVNIKSAKNNILMSEMLESRSMFDKIMFNKKNAYENITKMLFKDDKCNAECTERKPTKHSDRNIGNTKISSNQQHLVTNNILSNITNNQTYKNNIQSYNNFIQTYIQSYKKYTQSYVNYIQSYNNFIQSYNNYIQPYKNNVLSYTLIIKTCSKLLTYKNLNQHIASNNYLYIYDNIVGSGCVAQIYKAKLNNKDVVIKILHPNINETIQKDLNLLKIFAKYVVDINFFTQFEIDIKNQINLQIEHKNLIILRKNFAGFLSVKVPKPICSTKSILVEEYIHGRSLDKVVENEYNIEQSNTTSKLLFYSFVIPKQNTLFDYVCSNKNNKIKKTYDRELCNKIVYICQKIVVKMVLKDRFVHCDLHPGNIALTNNNKIVIYDAGMCRYMNNKEWNNFVDLIYEILYNKNYKKAAKLIFVRNKENMKRLQQIIFKNDKNISYRKVTVVDENISKLQTVNSFADEFGKALQTKNIPKAFYTLQKHNVKLDYNYSTIIISGVCLDGVLRKLANEPYKDFRKTILLNIPFCYAIQKLYNKTE